MIEQKIEKLSSMLCEINLVSKMCMLKEFGYVCGAINKLEQACTEDKLVTLVTIQR